MCLVPLALAGKPQGKEMVRVASQLTRVPASGRRIGGDRHTQLSQESLSGTSGLCLPLTLSLPPPGLPDSLCAFPLDPLSFVALPPSECALISYLI